MVTHLIWSCLNSSLTWDACSSLNPTHSRHLLMTTTGNLSRHGWSVCLLRHHNVLLFGRIPGWGTLSLDRRGRCSTNTLLASGHPLHCLLS